MNRNSYIQSFNILDVRIALSHLFLYKKFNWLCENKSQLQLQLHFNRNQKSRWLQPRNPSRAANERKSFWLHQPSERHQTRYHHSQAANESLSRGSRATTMTVINWWKLVGVLILIIDTTLSISHWCPHRSFVLLSDFSFYRNHVTYSLCVF